MIPTDAIVCMKCRRYFDQKTGEPVKDLEHILVVEPGSHDLCRPCSNAADMEPWETTTNV